jgi:branched-chain amino acid aminotransferase
MVVSGVQCIPLESVDQPIKNFHWLGFDDGDIRGLRQEGDRSGASRREGNVTEGPGFNVFSVRNAKLSTPDRGLFEGMTRRTVIELSSELGLPCEVRPVAAEELRNSDEIFIPSTAGGVMSVTDLDGRIYGNGKPGPITTALARPIGSAIARGGVGTVRLSALS